MNPNRQVDLATALTIIVLLTVILVAGLAFLRLSIQVVFVLAIAVTSLIALMKGFTLKQVQEFFLEGCKKSMLIVLILMSVGCVIGAWIVAGIVPSIIYYGLELLSPSLFLFVGCLICCIVSFFTGSSYTAAGTLGVAFMGIGYGLGIPAGITAGMVVSGTVFGDKMSPFSDTTNLASAVAGADIFEHIRSMMYTTVPPLLISLVLYFFLGRGYGQGTLDPSKIDRILHALDENFTVNPLLLAVPVITILLAVKRTPPLVALFLGAFLGIITAYVFQGQFGSRIILNSLADGFRIDSGVAEVDQLLNRGGISSMMGTVSLAILALGFGEILQKLGVLVVILEKIRFVIRTPGKLVVTTLITCLITNMLTASQYMAIILPGETLGPAYKKMGVALNVLSRTLEDGGTIFSYLVPWSMAAIYVSGVLDLSPWQYGPFAFLCILSPLFAVAYAGTGFAIFRASDKQSQATAAPDRASGL